MAITLLAVVGYTYRLDMQKLADRLLEEHAAGNNLSAQGSYPPLAQAAPATAPDAKPSGDRIAKELATGHDPSTQTSRPSPESFKTAESQKSPEAPNGPKSASNFVDSGSHYYNQQEYDKAIADYSEAIRFDPSDAATFSYRGKSYDALQKYDKAIADYTEAIRLDPNYAFAFYHRGIAYYHKKDFDRAIADYTQAIRLEPNYALAFYNRGIAKRSKGDPAGGESDIKAATAIDPNVVPPESKPGVPPVKIKTGIVRRKAKGNLVAQLKIEADANDYAIKLVDKKSSTEVLMFLVAANQTFETKVPLGTYRILAATGSVWYGEELLFGASTRYLVLQQLGGEDEFQFTFKNHTYYGHDLHLRPALDGTLSSVPTTSNEFQQR